MKDLVPAMQGNYREVSLLGKIGPICILHRAAGYLA